MGIVPAMKHVVGSAAKGFTMVEIRKFNPDGLSKPMSPYMHVVRATAQELVFIAGQVPTDASGATIGKGDFEAQCAQVFANIHTALRAVNADWKNVVQFTSYLVRPQDSADFRAFRSRAFPQMFPDGTYPANTLLFINRLADESYWLEVQTVAAL
jgi:enamine deaminase RidA (YjgF/YER057c/UK114 family)